MSAGESELYLSYATYDTLHSTHFFWNFTFGRGLVQVRVEGDDKLPTRREEVTDQL